jgi:hypothetical protein
VHRQLEVGNWLIYNQSADVSYEKSMKYSLGGTCAKLQFFSSYKAMFIAGF